MSIYNKETDNQHGYILIDNTLSTRRDSQIVTDIFEMTQKILISGDVNENQGSELSKLAADVVSSLTVSPPDTFVEEGK